MDLKDGLTVGGWVWMAAIAPGTAREGKST